ncbi:MAG: molecular chaperone [Pseudomonadota bacterium]
MIDQVARMRRKWIAGLTFLAGLLLTASAFAGGLTVSPIMVELSAKETAQGLWLSNNGSEPMRAQLRAYAWSQGEGSDVLQPTQELVLSPPMLTLGPGQQQLVRVIRTGASASSEKSYRILIDELPDPNKPQKNGLNFVMQFSVPVFALAVDQSKGAVPAAPLEWQIIKEGDKFVLTAVNAGTQRAQVADYELLDAQGKILHQQSGLLGYVLAGVTRRWSIPLTAANAAVATAIQGRINGEPVRQNLRVETGTR